MAIDFGDQGLVDSGRSSVGIPDTYVPIRGNSGAGDNAESLARALSGLSNTMNYVEDEQTKKQIAQQEYWVAKVNEQLSTKTPDDAITDVTSGLYHKAAAAVADSAGVVQGRKWILNEIASLNNADVLDPTELQARYDTIRGKALEIADQTKNGFYRGGFMQSVENFLTGKQDVDYENLIKRQNDLHGEALDNTLYDAGEAIIEKRVLPDDIGGNAEIQSMFGGGNGQITARAQNINYSGVTSFDDITSALMGKDEVKDKGTLNAFFRKSLGMNINPAEVPWCAAFVGGVLEAQGVNSTKSLSARSYLKFGKPTDSPTKGDIVVLSFGNDPNKGHVGFFVGYDENGNPKVLGGNQGNSVGIRSFNKENVVAYRAVPKMGSVITALKDRDPDGFPVDVETATSAEGAFFKPYQVASNSNEIPVPGSPESPDSIEITGENDQVTVAQPEAQPSGQPSAKEEEVLTPKVLMLRRAFFGTDSRYAKVTNIKNADRRDRGAAALMRLADKYDDPEILKALPEGMRNPKIDKAFDDLTEAIDRKVNARLEREERQDLKAKAKALEAAETEIYRIIQEEGYVDPFKASTITYTNSKGQTVEIRENSLFTIADAANKRDKLTESASVDMYLKLSDKIERSYRTGNWKEIFADDPQMLAAIGDKDSPSDLDVKKYILQSGMNSKEWTALINSVPEMKNSFKVMADPVVSSRYDDVVGFQVKTYLQNSTMTKKLAGVDADINSAVTNLGVSVRRTFDESYFQQYKAWKSRPENAGSAEPTYEEKLKMLDVAEQRAVTMLNSQRDWIDKLTNNEVTANMMAPGTQITATYEGKSVSGQVLADNGALVIIRGADGQDYALPKNTLTQSPSAAASPSEGQVRPFTEYDQSVQKSQPIAPVSNETPIEENGVSDLIDTVVPPVMNFMSTVGQGISNAYNSFEEAAKYKVNPKRLDTTSQKAIDVEKAVLQWANDPANAEQANKLLEEASTPMRKDRDYAVLYSRWNETTDITEKIKARDDLDNFMKKYRLDYIYKKISK